MFVSVTGAYLLPYQRCDNILIEGLVNMQADGGIGQSAIRNVACSAQLISALHFSSSADIGENPPRKWPIHPPLIGVVRDCLISQMCVPNRSNFGKQRT